MAVIKYRDKQGKLQLVNIPIYQVAVLPEGNQNLVGKILQYIGETTDDYTNGYFYKCESTSTEGLYAWTRINVQPAGGGTGGTSNYEDLENLPKIGGVILKGDKTLAELGINNFDGDYNSLQNIPESFTPSDHTHLVKDITDLDLTGYIEKTQGTENVGKILKVNDVGELVLAEDETGSSVSVSAQGTSTDSVRYITVDGTEYLISGSTESSLSELTDVNLIDITNGQILSYNSETSKWENIDAPSGTVVANPNEEIVKDLTKIKIDGTTYRIADDSIGKKVWYRFTTQSTGGNDASLNVTCDGTTKNYPYSTIRSNPLVVDGVFKLNYGLNGNQWRVTCLGDKVYYNNNLMENNSIIKEWGYGESVDFEIYNFTGTINEIIPNPEGEGAENLTKISINGTVYNVASGGSSSSIVPNPEDISAEAVELTGLRIDNNDYKITKESGNSQIHIGDEKPTDSNVLIWINTLESYDPTAIVTDNKNIWFSDGKFYNVDIYGEPTYWNESNASVGLDESTGMIYINKNNLAGGSNQAFIYMNNIISDEMKEKYSGIEIEYFVSAIAQYGGRYGAKAGFFASKNTFYASEYEYLNITDSLTILRLDFSIIPSGEARYFGFGGNITGYIKSIKLIKK